MNDRPRGFGGAWRILSWAAGSPWTSPTPTMESAEVTRQSRALDSREHDLAGNTLGELAVRIGLQLKC